MTIVDDRGVPFGLIREDDSVIMYNYRADRAREITMALTDATLEQPSRALAPKNLTYTMMTRYGQRVSAAIRAAARTPGQHSGRGDGEGKLEEPAGGGKQKNMPMSPTFLTAETRSLTKARSGRWWPPRKSPLTT